VLSGAAATSTFDVDAYHCKLMLAPPAPAPPPPAASAASGEAEEDEAAEAVSDELVARVNAGGHSWRAGRSARCGRRPLPSARSCAPSIRPV
jgi:hypothetical protein